MLSILKHAFSGCSVASRDISGRQLKLLSRSYSIPTSTNVDEVDVGDVGISGDVGVAIGDVVAAGDAASANAIAINQQVGELERYISGVYFCMTLTMKPLNDQICNSCSGKHWQ